MYQVIMIILLEIVIIVDLTPATVIIRVKMFSAGFAKITSTWVLGKNSFRRYLRTDLTVPTVRSTVKHVCREILNHKKESMHFLIHPQTLFKLTPEFAMFVIEKMPLLALLSHGILNSLVASTAIRHFLVCLQIIRISAQTLRNFDM